MDNNNKLINKIENMDKDEYGTIEMKYKNCLSEINKIGIKTIAVKLKISPMTLDGKLKNPNLFTLNELYTLQKEFMFTDEMILGILKKYI